MSESSSITTFKIGIRPLKSALIPIHVRAGGMHAIDNVEKFLNVLPDGIERTSTQTILLLKEGSDDANTELTCTVPSTVEPETVTTEVSFVGDLLGDALANLADLLAQPDGCGEQNLARFANTIIIYVYIQASGQMTNEIHNKIMLYIEGSQNLEGGMQKHMTLRTSDGGFRYFYYGRTNPSTFLTAFTVKIFRQAQTFMTIDQNLIDTALVFLITKQESDGGFSEDPTSEMYQYQGGLRDKTTLAAYIAILLTRLLGDFPQYTSQRDRAISFILANSNSANAYQLALICNALHFAGHSSFHSKYDELLSLAIETPDIMYWDVTSGTVLNVETVSYALLFISEIDTAKSIKLARYLISKKAASGGWASTQDTVMAIESLASVAALVTVYDGTLELVVRPRPVGNLFYLDITPENQIQQQSFALDPLARRVTIFAQGETTGKAIISFTCRYFEKFDNIPPRFNVQYKLLDDCNTPLRAEVCINYIAQGDDQRSNMVIMKMQMPSGYIFDPDTTPSSSYIRVSMQPALNDTGTFSDS